MTGPEYKAEREALGLTQEALAAVMGISRATVNRRESDAAPITPEMERALRDLQREKAGR